MQKKLLFGFMLLSMMLFSSLSMAAETVNLNKASAAAIQQNLVGIGPIKAEAIISYRKKNGKYKSLDDLQNVTGIGPALIKKNKRYLSLTKGVVSGDDKAYATAKKSAVKSKSGTKKKASTAKKTTKKKSTTAKAADTKKKSTTSSKKKTTTDKKSTSSSKSTSKKKKKKKKKTTAGTT